jgi:hypothetical protein
MAQSNGHSAFSVSNEVGNARTGRRMGDYNAFRTGFAHCPAPAME